MKECIVVPVICCIFAYYFGILIAMELFDTAKLEHVFDKTTSTYKYYWMLALLDIVKQGRGHQQITFTEMVARMLGKAWQPLKYGKFSFGKCDAMIKRINRLIECSPLNSTSLEDRARLFIMNNANTRLVADIINEMTKYVPYRFLYPWLGTLSNTETAIQSQNPLKRCLYRIEGKTITINDIWIHYIVQQEAFLEGFTYDRLFRFLENRNPGFVLPVESSMVKTADGSCQHRYLTLFNEQVFPDMVAEHRQTWKNLEIHNHVNGPYIEHQIIKKNDKRR